MTFKVSQDRGFKEFWGWDGRVVRELGAKVAHNSPHEQGGPSEWRVTPPEGVQLDRPLEGPLAALLGVSTKCEPARLTRRMINEARSWVPLPLFLGPLEQT